jgi:hypothetical protein
MAKTVKKKAEPVKQPAVNVENISRDELMKQPGFSNVQPGAPATVPAPLSTPKEKTNTIGRR